MSHDYLQLLPFSKCLLGPVALSVANQTADAEVACSIPTWHHTFSWDWSWNVFYGHSPSSTDYSTRAVVSYKRKNVHEVLLNLLVKLSQEKSVVMCLDMAIAVDFDIKPQPNKQIFKMRNTLKGKNWLPKGANSFLLEQSLMIWKNNSPHQMIYLEYLQFFIMHKYTLPNASYAYAWCHSHQTQGFGLHLISTYGLMASCLCNKCNYFITWLLLWILFCYLCFVSVMLSYLFIAALWSPAGKGLTSWLSCMWCFLVTFPCGVLGQVWYLILLTPDLCLTYSNNSFSVIYCHALPHWQLIFDVAQK